jgi:hypothetical protein
MDENVLEDINDDGVLVDDSMFDDNNTTHLNTGGDDEDDVDFDSFDDDKPDW